MKFANIYYPYGSIYKKQENSTEAINIGDVFQYLALENLYKSMGIHTKETIKINRYELADYNGEYVVLPINCNFTGFTSGTDITNFSSKIIPVFLGLSIVNDFLSQSDIDYLKKFEPIGCRDEFTLRVMRKYGIKSWLNGCMTLTFSKKSSRGNKILLIDCPDAVRDILPEYKNIEIGTHIWNNDYYAMEEKVQELYEYYKTEAKLVITSRLHCATPCMAAGIPVILAKDSFGTGFSWIDKLIPLYPKEKYHDINWKCKAVEIEELKSNMIENAKRMLNDIFEKYQKKITISEFFESSEYTPIKNDIYEKTIEWINSQWNKDAAIQYAIWGFTQISKSVIHYIKLNYKNARLIAIFDKYRKFTYDNMQSSDIECMENYNNIKILVMGNAACNFYRQHCNVCGNNEVYLCY